MAAITFTSLDIQKTPWALDVEFLWGGGNAGDTCRLEFKESSSGTWRRHLGPSGGDHIIRQSLSGYNAFTGSVFGLTPNTSYDLRLIVAAPDGVPSSGTLTTTVNGSVVTASTVTQDSGTQATITCAAVTTRADPTRSHAATLALALADGATKYVAMTGNDSTGDGSSGSPWRTITKGFQEATTYLIVEPGYYVTPTVNLPAGVTVVGRNAPVSYDSSTRIVSPANSGSRSVIFGAMIGKTGASETWLTGVALWDVYDATDATYVLTAAEHGLGANADSVRQLGYAATAADLPKRIPYWKQDAAQLASASSWSDFVASSDNLLQKYGFWQASNGDVYLRMPPWETSTNPDDWYITLGNQIALTPAGNDCTISGLELRCMDRGVNLTTQARTTVTDCLFANNLSDLFLKPTAGPTYAVDTVVRRCYGYDANLWNSVDRDTKPPISWYFIKDNIRVTVSSSLDTGTAGNGRYEGTNAVGTASQTQFIYAEGYRRLSAVECTVDGKFNVISCFTGSWDRYASSSTDIFDGYFIRICDDIFEPEAYGRNHRYWRNHGEEMFVILSMADVYGGPIYVCRNRFKNHGSQGMNESGNGSGEAANFVAYAFKYGGAAPASFIRPTLFWAQNTLHSTGTLAAGPDAGGGGDSTGYPFIRSWNNLERFTNRVADVTSDQYVAHDYTVSATSHASDGFRRNGTTYTTNVSAWRTAMGMGTNSQLLNAADVAFSAEATVDALVNADLTLVSGTNHAVNAGVILGNVADVSNASPSTWWEYDGAAPDLGFQERAFSTAADTTPPTFSSAQVPAAGLSVVVTLTEAGSPPVLPASSVTGFTVTVGGVSRSILTATRTGNTEITLSLGHVILSGQTVTVAYTPGNVTDSAGTPNSMASFGAQSVTNNSTQAGRAAASGRVARTGAVAASGRVAASNRVAV